jgi:hypothetical protein
MGRGSSELRPATVGRCKMKNRIALGILIATSLSGPGCNKSSAAGGGKADDGPGQLTYTREGKSETLKLGAAFIQDNHVVAVTDCDAVTCDMLVGGWLQANKADPACPGGYRWVNVILSNASEPPQAVTAGNYDKSSALKPQVDVMTKNNEGSHGWNAGNSAVTTLSVGVELTGSDGTITIDAADSLASLKGSLKAKVCPAQ